MHWHELLEQVAALVLVTSGTFFLAAAWLARRKVPRLSHLEPERSATGLVTIGVVPIVGLIAVAVALVAASLLVEVPDGHHHGSDDRSAHSSSLDAPHGVMHSG